MALPSSILKQGLRSAQPAATAVAAGTLFCVTDENYIIEQSDGSSWTQYTPGVSSARNMIINGGFQEAQRQVAGTLTTYSDTASRTYTADRWAVTNENASIQYVRGITSTTPETGITAIHYGTYSKITNAGKIVVSQCMLAEECDHVRGKKVRLQLKMKASTATTMRVALMQLTSAGTVDTIPGHTNGTPSGTFISAFGAASTDPTFGANLSKINPDTADNATIANTGLTCSVTTTWQRFGGTFTLPSDYKNLVLVVFSDGQIGVGASFSLTEVGLYDNIPVQVWTDTIRGVLVAQLDRYYFKSFPNATAPAQSAGLSGSIRGYVSVAGAVANQPIGIRYNGIMRTGAPTITFYNPSAANAFARNTSVGADSTATAAANTSGVSTEAQFTGVAGWLAGAAMAVHVTVDAEF